MEPIDFRNFADECVRLAQQAQALKKKDLAVEALDRALLLEPNYAKAWELKLRWGLAQGDETALLKRRISSRPAVRSSMRNSRYVATYGVGRGRSTPL